MKFYESGDNRKPVIFLFPGTCCLYSSFDHVLDGLHSYFYTVTVSYDGFDPNEKTEFYSDLFIAFCTLCLFIVITKGYKELSFFEEKESGHKVRSDKQQQLRSHL